RLVATWGSHAADTPSADARLIGATAAMLAIPLLPADAAAELAAREGIVCHLTSLVLVDEAGTRHEGITATRKVELSAPRAAAPASASMRSMGRMLMCMDYEELPRMAEARGRSRLGGGPALERTRRRVTGVVKDEAPAIAPASYPSQLDL